MQTILKRKPVREGKLILTLVCFSIPFTLFGEAPKKGTNKEGSLASQNPPTLLNTTNLGFTIHDAATLQPVAGALLTITGNGDQGTTNAVGLVQFTGDDVTANYWPKGSFVHVLVTAPGYRTFQRTFMTLAVAPTDCACPNRHSYEIRLRPNGAPAASSPPGGGGGPSIGGGGQGGMIQNGRMDDYCFFETISNQPLPCCSHKVQDGWPVEAFTPPLGSVQYINGAPSGQLDIKTSSESSFHLKASVSGQTSGLLKKLGFKITAPASGGFDVTKKVEIEETIGANPIPGFNGTIALRAKVAKMTLQEFCHGEDGVLNPRGDPIDIIMVVGTCTAPEGNDDCKP
ncbi:MAG: carboxypeptidase-like regulatory domain-containing protein [Planctomycetota bacterium]